MAYTPPSGDAVGLAVSGDYTPPAGDAAALAIPEPETGYSAPAGDAVALPIVSGYTAPAGDAVDLPMPEPVACYTAPAGDAVQLAIVSGYTPPPGDAVDLAIECDIPIIPPDPPLEFDIDLTNTPRLMSAVALAFRSERPQNAAPGLAYGSAERHDALGRLSWERAQRHAARVAIRWAPAAAHDERRALPWKPAAAHDDQRAIAWSAAVAHDDQRGLAWEHARAMDRRAGLAWGDAHPSDAALRILFGAGEQLTRDERLAFGTGDQNTRDQSLPWGDAYPLDLNHNPVIEYVPPVVTEPGCYPPPPGDMVPLAFAGADTSYTPPSGDSVELPIRCTGRSLYFRRVRVTEHTATLCRLPGREALSFKSATISNDMDSFARTATITLTNLASYLLVQPGPAGYHTVELAIDGAVWNFLVLGGTENRSSSGASTWTLNCVGRSKMLDEPFVTRRSYSNPSAAAAEALILNELSGTGWALDYEGPAWTVPAGAFNYSNLSPIAAIKQIANACGCFVTHDPDSDTLQVRKRYSAWPWDWDTAPIDVTIANGALRGITKGWEQGPGYLGVYVGGTTQGVMVNVKRAGSSGSPYADLVLDPLITENAPGIQKGGTVIADSESIDPRTIRLPYLNGAPGEVFPGELVRVTDSVHGTFNAVAKASTITVNLKNDAVSVEQQCRVDQHYPVELA